jgi:hypothetical protein
MPLIGGRDLRSPVAELRVATRDLDAERANGVEKNARIARLEAELAEAISRAAQLAAHRDGGERAFAAEREVWLQQKVALQAGKTALEGELAETRARLSAATNLRAQRDSQVAQLRAEIEDTTQQLDAQREAIVALEGERTDWEAARLRLDGENRDLSSRIEEASRENEALRRHATLSESEAGAAQEHAIGITHFIAPLVEELSQARRSFALGKEAAARDKALLETQLNQLAVRVSAADTRAAELEAKIAGSPGARLAALWRRLAVRSAVLLRPKGVPTYGEELKGSNAAVPKNPGNA